MALTSMVATLGAGVAGQARAAETSAAGPSAVSTESAPARAEGKKPLPLNKGTIESIKGALIKANTSKDPNIFYGGILIRHTLDQSGHDENPLHGSANKNLRERLGVPLGDTVFLTDPVIEYYNGRKYAIVYNRGPIYEFDKEAKDASITEESLYSGKNIFVDLTEAEQNNGGKLEYYSHATIKPKMVRSVVLGQQRFLAEKMPQYNSTAGIYWSFSSKPNDPDSPDNFVVNHGFMKVPGYKLPDVKH